MRKLPHVLFVLLLVIAAMTIFQGCNNEGSENGDIADETVIASNDVDEAKLPKGQEVIDDNTGFVSRPNPDPIAPVGAPPKTSENSEGESPEPSPESRAETLKKVYKHLLVFHADDTMEVNKAKLATLILAKNESIAKLKVQVLDESNAGDEKIQADTSMDFGSKMRAKLISFGGSKLDNSFEIEPLGSDEQSFKTDRKKLIWQWKITPLKEGQHELKLSIQIIEKDGEAVYLPAKNIPVVIFAKKMSFMARVGNFLSTKYEWVITAILLPVFIAWLTTRIRNKNSRPAQSQS
jgi:hypothetical protein